MANPVIAREKPRTPVAAVGLLMIALAAATAVVGGLVWQSLQLRTEIDTKRTTLETLARAVKDGRGLAGAAPNRALFAAATSGRVGAELQARLDQLGRQAGVQIESVQVLPYRQEGRVLTASAEVAFKGDVSAMSKFLHAIETGWPVLTIDEFAVRGLAPSPEAAPSTGTRLDATLRVQGLAHLPEGR